MFGESLNDQVKNKLVQYGFTQWRYDIGSKRGELSNSYRNYALDLNVVLYNCTYDIRCLSTGQLLVERGDMFNLNVNLNKGIFA